MSTIEEQLYAVLNAVAPNAVYANVARQDLPMPYVIYRCMPSPVENVLDSQTPPADNTVFELDCWGRTYADAVNLAATVRAALQAWSVRGVQKTSAHDLYEEDVKAYRRVFEFSVWQ
ncbi:Protein of uncharacterised function (DUF3168) [Burkholderia pseudomallei]|uniref:tail completion protein gp17 n=1 Tax=Burkholderia pseudomallei TaxID=28450 RepID=UPI0005E3D473|nr:DUF3168 domain-containing protein [Burkholderia pseudomallei]CAK1277634.1 Protein of uncharacterised function (DUF3168) [Burkholderia pseudomallei]